MTIRRANSKETHESLKQKFAQNFSSSSHNDKKFIWIHAASIGEFKSSDLIIDRYHKVFHILVTTTTKSSADYIKEFYKNKVVHQLSEDYEHSL